MPNQSNKIENLLNELPLLRKIDLSLSRIHRLNKDLNTDILKLQKKTITVSGTNGKWSTSIFLRSILEAANYKIDVFSSPHLKSYTERFVFESQEISEEDLCNLLSEVGLRNGSKPITIFEFLTAAFYFYASSKSKSDVIISENGLFKKYDSVDSIGNHLMNISCSISEDHLEWLPEGKRNIDQIIIEKTSNINSANIVVAKQSDEKILQKIKKSIEKNPAKKILYSTDYSFEVNKDGFLYKDNLGTLQLPRPPLLGAHQYINAASAVAAIRNLKKYEIKEKHIIEGIKSVIDIKGRLEIINNGFLKKLAPSNTIICDIAHNPGAGSVISKYLDTLDEKKAVYLICGMMNNKAHKKFLSNFKKAKKILTVDIPNNKNCIKKEKLKEIIEEIGIKTETSKSIQDAIKYIANKDQNSIILIIGSIFLISEVLNLNN